LLFCPVIRVGVGEKEKLGTEIGKRKREKRKKKKRNKICPF